MVKLVVAKTSACDNTDKGTIKTAIMAGNGIFEEKKSWIGTSIKKVNDYKVQTYPEMEESLVISDHEFPKIPKEAIQYVIGWYREVTLDSGDEAQINFYRIKDKQKDLVVELEDGTKTELCDIDGLKFWSKDIFSYVPLQSNSKASTSVHSKDLYYNELNKQYGLYVETHSHNSMQAFRSGTDEANSHNDGLQLVFGQLNTEKPKMYAWITIREVQKAGLTPDEVKKFVEIPDYNFIESDNKFSFNLSDLKLDELDEDLLKQWDDKVAQKPPVVKYTKTTPYYSSKVTRGTSYYNNVFDLGEYEFDFEYLTYKDKIEMAINNVLNRHILENDLTPLEVEELLDDLDILITAFKQGTKITTSTTLSISEIEKLFEDCFKNCFLEDKTERIVFYEI